MAHQEAFKTFMEISDNSQNKTNKDLKVENLAI